MELVVHGTKRGFRASLYKTPNAPSIAYDIRNNVRREDVIGKSLYAIALAPGGCVFTKYIMVIDTLRHYSNGDIAFSLFLPANEKLAGEDIKKLLDKLLKHYVDNYIKDNKVNRGEKNIIREDWTFVDDILNEYKSKLEYKSISEQNDDRLPLNQNLKEPAFVYYLYIYKDSQTQKETEFGLLDIFNAPFQDEYKDYKQIFFIEKELRGKLENPLNALRHNPAADLTGKIDLENLRYTLTEFDGRGKDGITIEIRANDRKLSNKDSIRKKDNIRIKYSKNEYFIDIDKNGKLTDDNIREYLSIVDENKIKVKNDVELQKVPKKIFVEVNQYGKAITDAKIICNNTYSGAEKNVTNNEINFEGEELKNKWTVSAKIDDNVYSEPQDIIPKDRNDNDVVHLTLKEHKTVEFDVKNEREERIVDYQLSVKNKDDKIKIIDDNKKIEFIGEAIEGKWDIDVSSSGYETKTLHLRPKTQNEPVGVILKEKQDQQGGMNGDKNSQYKKKRSVFNKLLDHPKLCACIVIALAVLGLGVWALWPLSGTNKPVLNSTPITKYVKSIELNKDTLEKFSKNWENKRPKIKQERASWLSVFGIGSKKEKLDSTNYKKWRDVRQSIDTAKSIRYSINEADFANLKKLNYSDKQRKFDTVVKNLDSAKYEYVKKQLGDVSGLNLNQIAVRIDSIVKTQIDKQSNTSTSNSKRKDNTGNTQARQNHAQSSSNSSTNSSVAGGNSANSSPSTAPSSKNTPDISTELQGDNITPQKLSEYEKDKNIFAQFSTSIKLYRRFFELIKDGNKEKDTFTNLCNNEIKKDALLRNSKLKSFLEKICKDSKVFETDFVNKIDRVGGKQDRVKLSLSEIEKKLR
jgi:hypothetical protein